MRDTSFPTLCFLFLKTTREYVLRSSLSLFRRCDKIRYGLHFYFIAYISKCSHNKNALCLVCVCCVLVLISERSKDVVQYYDDVSILIFFVVINILGQKSSDHYTFGVYSLFYWHDFRSIDLFLAASFVWLKNFWGILLLIFFKLPYSKLRKYRNKRIKKKNYNY